MEILAINAVQFQQVFFSIMVWMTQYSLSMKLLPLLSSTNARSTALQPVVKSPAFKIGGSRRFRKQAIEQWINQHSNQRTDKRDN